jgi:hypothetical protein
LNFSLNRDACPFDSTKDLGAGLRPKLMPKAQTWAPLLRGRDKNMLRVNLEQTSAFMLGESKG